MFTISFWKDTFARAVATAAEAALALIGTSTLIEAVSWQAVGSTAGLAFIATVVKCIAATGALKKGAPEDLAKDELDDEDLKTIMKEEADENEGN
ncbi:hypothetical protein GCWU000322_00092 [Eubacterium saphenum ATCC 49989]|nr:hypothetical protein GCWU000322_00092 [Eubacterium saphenum ATCC 49989]